jgi:allantoinase
VRGGCIVLPNRVTPLDVVAVDGQIVALARPDQIGPLDVDELIRADGLLVMPGAVDAHVHFDEPGRTEWEGFDTGSAAAAAGGVTTVVDMPIDSDPPTITVDALLAKGDAARAHSRVDVALWAGLVPASVDVLAAMAHAGAIGFKTFTCPSGWNDFPEVDEAALLAGSTVAAAVDLPVAVHCEFRELGDGPTSEVAALRWAASITASAGARMHAVHVSAVEAVDEAHKWTHVTVETCPHYLVLDDDEARAIGPRARCAPRIRSAINRRGLWERLRAGAIDTVASDHSPCPPTWRDQEPSWAGIAGVQLTVPALLDAGLAPIDVARLTTEAARILRLPSKGALAVGFDADLCLVDPDAVWTVCLDDLRDRHGASPLLERTLRGRVVRTIVRGRTVYVDGDGVCDPGGARVLRPMTSERGGDGP